MLTPIEIQSKNFKSGIGYDKKDVEAFRKDVLASYEKIYKENVELKDKLNVLNEGIQYYKSIEKTLQKALVLAEKTAEETKQVAIKKAEVIEKEAHSQAAAIIADSKNEVKHLQTVINQLESEYEKYKVQFKQLASSQLELLNSPTFDLARLNTVAYSQMLSTAQESSTESVLETPVDDITVSSSTEVKDSSMNDQLSESASTVEKPVENVLSADSSSDCNTTSTTSSENDAFEFLDFDVKLD